MTGIVDRWLSRPSLSGWGRGGAVALLACCWGLHGTAVLGLASDTVFEEIATDVGLDFVHFNGMTGRLFYPEMTGGGVAVLDYDNDGDLDVYVGQGARLGEKDEKLVVEPTYPEPVTDRLYRNRLVEDGKLSFEDVTAKSGLSSATGYNMGVSTGDFDSDGWVDVYTVNLGSNHLLRNRGDGTFEDVTFEAGADDSSWSVAASFLDYDRDGWPRPVRSATITEWPQEPPQGLLQRQTGAARLLRTAVVCRRYPTDCCATRGTALSRTFRRNGPRR